MGTFAHAKCRSTNQAGEPPKGDDVRRIQIFNLAVIGATIAMAFAGASLASANVESIVVCGKAELVCEDPLVTEIVEGKTVAQIHGTAKNPKLLSSLGTVECEKSLANITVLNLLGKSITGHVTELSFTGNCHLGSTECKVTTESLGDISFTHGSAPLEAIAESNGGTTARVICSPFINCLYGGKPQLTVHSSGTGETKLLAAEAKFTEAKGFLCPSTSKWDATYAASGSMWIES